MKQKGFPETPGLYIAQREYDVVLLKINWEFSKIESIDTRVFPKTAFKVNGNLDLGTDEKLSLRNTYYRFVQSGVSSSKIIRALMYEYHVTMEQIISLINEFDAC